MLKKINTYFTFLSLQMFNSEKFSSYTIIGFSKKCISQFCHTFLCKEKYSLYTRKHTFLYKEKYSWYTRKHTVWIQGNIQFVYKETLNDIRLWEYSRIPIFRLPIIRFWFFRSFKKTIISYFSERYISFVHRSFFSKWQPFNHKKFRSFSKI